MNTFAILFLTVFIMPFLATMSILSEHVIRSNNELAIVAKSRETLTAGAAEGDNIPGDIADEVETNDENMNHNSNGDSQVKPEGEEKGENDNNEVVVEETEKQVDKETENNKDDEKMNISPENNDQMEVTTIIQSSTTDRSVPVEEGITAGEELNAESSDYQEDQGKPNDDENNINNDNGINEEQGEVTKNLAENQLSTTTVVTSKEESDAPLLKNNSKFKCYACNGLTDANCTKSPKFQIDCKPVLTSMTERGCYTLVQGAKTNITRGCIFDLAQEGIAYCKKHVTHCVLCFSDGCNNRTLIASNYATRQLSCATLAILLLLTLSNACLW